MAGNSLWRHLHTTVNTYMLTNLWFFIPREKQRLPHKKKYDTLEFIFFFFQSWQMTKMKSVFQTMWWNTLVQPQFLICVNKCNFFVVGCEGVLSVEEQSHHKMTFFGVGGGCWGVVNHNAVMNFPTAWYLLTWPWLCSSYFWYQVVEFQPILL